MSKLIMAIAMWHSLLSGANTPTADGDLQSGNELQFYSIELINSSIAGIRAEMLNNKYPENMKHEIREHVQFSYTDFLMSVISPRDPASGLPTGKRQHKPVSSSGLPSGAVVSGLQSNSTQGGVGYDE